MAHHKDLYTALESIEDLLERADFIAQAYDLNDLGITQVRERLLAMAQQHIKT